MNVEDVYLPIPDNKLTEFYSGTFGINRHRRKDRIAANEQNVYEAFALYFDWALKVEDPDERENALKEGEFALQDMQTYGGELKVREGTPGHEHYEGLHIRRHKIDNVEMRRRVFGRIAHLAFDSQPTNVGAKQDSSVK